ncbi:MAG TPA: tetratricopeptide repeat protein, partial [Kofleriaceae bacterium]|nr:tetratricopeptide repeat protein [Kofleriaceae bacterium]
MTTVHRIRLAAWPRRAGLAALVLALAAWQPFRTADPDVEAGNRAYAEGRYDDALAAYDRAARRGGVDGDGLAFDRGTTELKKAEATRDAGEKQRLTQRALEDLKQAGHARDPRIRGQAHYNRGNLMMGQDKLDDAIEAYKQALREQPDLDDARLNLELALRRRQKQQQQAKQNQGQQGQGQGQPGQG